MLVKDEATLAKHQAWLDLEAYQDKLSAWVRDKMLTQSYVEVSGNDPRVWERQKGRQITSTQLETMLKPFLPSSCHFLQHPTNPSKRFIGQDIAGTMTTVIVYEHPLMPEFSLLANHSEQEWDGHTTHIDRKDLTPGRTVGVQTINQPGVEVIRGWRTVIIRLVKEGFLTPSQADSLMGSTDRPEWQFGLGKTAHSVTPW